MFQEAPIINSNTDIHLKPFENSGALNKLGRAKHAAFDDIRFKNTVTCLSGTRVGVLKEIEQWCCSSVKEPIVYWLNGMAGTGKSTIAHTIARNCSERGQLGATFFFSAIHNETSPDMFFTTIAFQLASNIPHLKTLIAEVIDTYPDISEKILDQQWRRLIFEPLNRSRPLAPGGLIIVIDALDECQQEDIGLILRILSQAEEFSTTRLKFLVTSRPEPEVQDGFRRMVQNSESRERYFKTLRLHDIPRKAVDDDLANYFQHELHGLGLIPRDISLLVEKAEGLFIWAATACIFLRGGSYRRRQLRLSSLLEARGYGKDLENLDKIYYRILMNCIDGDFDEEERKDQETDLKCIVGTIVILFNPLSKNGLSQLLDMPLEIVRYILGDLCSVIIVPDDDTQPIHLLHLSFRDFILSEKRCPDSSLRVDEKQAHSEILLRCLRRMSETLKEDMCNLQLPGVSSEEVNQSAIHEALPSDVQYACRYWVDHLIHSDIVLDDDHEVHEFLRNRFLYFLEALILIKRMPEVIHALQKLESFLSVSSNSSILPTVD